MNFRAIPRHSGHSGRGLTEGGGVVGVLEC
jgi:hypothetical protein